MEELNNSTRRFNGAFRPITGCYNSDYPKRLPPKRFVASRLAGGLKDLFTKLSNSKDVQTQENKNENGILHSNPVPNLAGRYKILQLIGRGQSSILVAAEDLYHPTKQMVAIKIMNLDYKALGAQEADCIQQLNRADPLKFSKIVRLLNKFMFDDHYCMTFELLRPRPLHQYFQRTELDSEDEILEKVKEVTTQILGVLGFLRRENVIHADLKPENILLESGEKMRIKVVDFGNAIRWVHQEMSLYYDNFELQTLLYRAPEVMFGVPFGPEIDMWSLGCIVAELYVGEPLFMGQNKMGVLQEMVSILGPFPRIPFQSGKFYSEFAGFISSKTGPLVPSLEVRLMKKLHNMKNFTFANFLSGLLQYNPNNRLTPAQAASHPFLASHVPFAEFLTTEDELQGRSETRRSGILLTPSQYTYRPIIDDDIRRQHLSSLDLLHCGTRGKDSLEPKRTRTPPVGRVVPRVNYDRSKPNDKKDTKRHLDQEISERRTPKNEVTQNRTPQSGRNSTQKLMQKSLKIEGNAKPVSSNMLVNKNDGFPLHEPAGRAQMADGKEILLANQTRGAATLNILVTSLDERRHQRSSGKIVDTKTQMPKTVELDEKYCQSNDASKDKRYQWLEGGMPNNTSIDADSMRSQKQTEYVENTSSARTRVYRHSKKPQAKEDSLLLNNELNLSGGSSTNTDEGFVLSEGLALQASSSSESNLPESYSEVETSRMSYATCDSSDDETIEEYQSLHNTKKNKRSMSYATCDKSKDDTIEDYRFSPNTNETNKRTMSYATCDKSKYDTVEEYQSLRNTKKTTKRSTSYATWENIEEYQSLRNTSNTNKRTTPSIKMSDVKKSSNSLMRTMLSDASPSLSDDFSSENEMTESRTKRGSSSKKNVKLYELKKATAQNTTRIKTQGDSQRRATPKRARRSLKLMYPHEDDEVNLL